MTSAEMMALVPGDMVRSKRRGKTYRVIGTEGGPRFAAEKNGKVSGREYRLLPDNLEKVEAPAIAPK